MNKGKLALEIVKLSVSAAVLIFGIVGKIWMEHDKKKKRERG